MTARPQLDPLDAWLDRAAAGARDVTAYYEGKVTLRGTAYPVDTESEPYLPDQSTPRDAQHITIPLWLRSCKRCKQAKPEDKQYCDTCQELLWEREAEYKADENYRRRFEHMNSVR